VQTFEVEDPKNSSGIRRVESNKDSDVVILFHQNTTTTRDQLTEEVKMSEIHSQVISRREGVSLNQTLPML
jgi:hypothetical protein